MAEPWDDERLTAYGLLVEARDRTGRRIAVTLERHGVDPGMFEMLLRLARSPSQRLRLGQLADALTVTSGGVTRLLDRAVSAGLAVRERCPGDARGYYATLSEQGRELLRRVLPEHVEDLERYWLTPLGELAPAALAGLRRARDAAHSPTGCAAPPAS